MEAEPGNEVRELTPAEKLELVQEQCAILLRDAAEARNLAQPNWGSSPHEVHAGLVKYRAGLDRLEGTLIHAMTLKDAMVSAARKAEQAADDAWDDEAKKNRGRGGEYEGAQERYAVWRIKTRPQREAARLLREAADLASSAEARIRVAYRGLDGGRLDLHKRLSALAFEDSVSRPG